MKICPRCSELHPDDAQFCPFDGAALEKSTDPLVGRTIAARYRVQRRLGAGGMANVYLARHVIIERLCAIKVLRQDLALDPSNRERFLREARAVNRINHPNIVEITDYGEVEGLAYLVMEYVEGESLLEHMRRGALPWPRATHLAAQIASALARAHQMGVIHRDLKPENVIVLGAPGTREERVKLTDFGIAKIVDAPSLTFNEQVFGTPGYIAPEYVEGLPTDGRADLYALGVLLYETITCVLPYDARTQADKLLKPLTTAPTPPSERIAGLPPELESLLLRLLARSPDDRPHDAFAVVDALHDVLRRYANPSLRPPPVALSAPSTPSSVPPARTSSPTLDQPPPTSAAGPPTANEARVKTSEIATRWGGALADLEASIQAKARERGGTFAADRASELAGVAREMTPRVERAQRAVADAQAKVDRLEAQGREFRANLGHAIDVLVRDRSRERAHLEALVARGASMETSGGGPASVDMRVWERAALDTELERMARVDDDLTFQIDTLQRQLELKNEGFEREMVEAAGALEGGLAAVRRLTNELVKTLDEAAAILAGEERISRSSFLPPE